MDQIGNRLPWLGYPTHVWGMEGTCQEKLVLICLWSYAHRDGSGAFPSQSTLAENCGLSERTTRDTLKSLVDRGIVDRTRTQKGHRYVLSHPAAPAGPTGSSRRFHPAAPAGDEMPVMGCHDGNPLIPPRGDSSEGVLSWWNGVAETHGLKKITKVSAGRLRKYKARVKSDPEFRRMLELALPKRKQFFRESQQPDFDQAVREDYFDRWIRDLGWEDASESAGVVDHVAAAMKAKGLEVIRKAKARERGVSE